MTEQEKRSAVNGIDLMVRIFDQVKEYSDSSSLADAKGRASLAVLRALEDWRNAIVAEETSETVK
jgi:hypothetical protein